MADKTGEMAQNTRRVFINDIGKYTSKNIARVRFIYLFIAISYIEELGHMF